MQCLPQRSSGVRIGPISLLTLVAVILLSVLAMLCVTTTNATQTMSKRQASALTDTYTVDSCGQALLAEVDSCLSSASSSDVAADKIDADFPALAAQARKNTETKRGSNLKIKGSVSDRVLSFTIKASSGKRLKASIVLNDDLTYTITSWKITTVHKARQETLWSGSNQ